MILYHPDRSRVGERALPVELRTGDGCALSPAWPVFRRADRPRDRPLEAPDMASQPVVLRSDGDGGVQISAAATDMRYTVDGQPGAGLEQISATRVRRGVLLGLGERVLLLLGWFWDATPNLQQHGMLGVSDAIERTRKEITQFAGLDVPVLIRGETGSGKERVAHAIHAASRRAHRPFVAINMAAIAPSAAASELFGHKRGAFTDAVSNHAGFFGAADGGTLFLDEVGETPVGVQALLLRALDEGQVQPVGGETRQVDVRLIAATDADLEQLVADGRFREALLHRIEVCSIDVPPLRKRREEIPALLLYFLDKQLSSLGAVDRLDPPPAGAPPWLPYALVHELVTYDWPGNIRQLRNVATEMAIRCAHLPTALVPASLHRAPRPRKRQPSGPVTQEPAKQTGEGRRATNDGYASAPGPASRDTPWMGAPYPARPRPAHIPDERIAQTLREHDWNVTGAARTLGVAKNTLVARLKAMPGVRQSTELSADEIARARERFGDDLAAVASHLQVSQRALAHRLYTLDKQRVATDPS